jgi:hypothetical protein
MCIMHMMPGPSSDGEFNPYCGNFDDTRISAAHYHTTDTNLASNYLTLDARLLHLHFPHEHKI